MTANTPRAPAGLDAGGRRLWRALTTSYEWRVDEIELLEQACRARDTVDRVADAAANAPTIVEGSVGQPRPNPLLAELRAQRAAYAKLIEALQVPDPTGAAGEVSRLTSSQRHARKAAQARWNGRGREGSGA
jgi:hypothetical protein